MNALSLCNVSFSQLQCASSHLLPIIPLCFALVSQLRYKEQCYTATPVSTTPEIERVRKNQEQLSTASCFCFFLYFTEQYIFVFFTTPSEKALDPLHLGRFFSTVTYWGAGTVDLSCESRKLGTVSLSFSPACLFKKSSLGNVPGIILVTGTQRWIRPHSW